MCPRNESSSAASRAVGKSGSANLVQFAASKMPAITTKRKAYQKALQDGSVDPQRFYKERYQDTFAKIYQQLVDAQQEIREEPSYLRRKSLSRDLQRVLEPFGPFLEYANYKTYNKQLSEAAMKEAKVLEEIDVSDQPDPNSKNVLRVSGGSDCYTLLHVPVFLDVEGPAHSWVYLDAGGGGEFSNGLLTQRLQTDGQGKASTFWVSREILLVLIVC